MIPVLSVSVNPAATVVRLQTNEQIFGSTVVVELDNSDGSLDAAAYKGLPITFSMNPGGGIPDMWVWTQEKDSREGKEILRLTCVDAWTFLNACQAAITGQMWNNPMMLQGDDDPNPGEPWARFAAYYNIPVATIISTLLSSTISGSLDNDDAMPTLLRPTMTINNAYSGVQEALNYTPGFLRVNGSVFTYVDPATLAVVKTYTTDDATSVTVLGAGVTIPNRVYVEAIDTKSTLFQEGDPVIYTGSAQDDTSHAAVGIWIDYHQQDYSGSLTSDADCDEVAAAILAKLQAQTAQGLIITNHTTFQTLLQKITGVDARGNSVTGIIYQIKRTYDRGEYNVQFILGGATGSALGSVPQPPNVVPGTSLPPSLIPPTGGLTIGAYIADIAFTSVDWDTVSWGAGLVTLADGRSQATDVGSFDMTADGAWYFYVILGNSTVQHSQTATDAVGEDRMFVGVASRGSTIAQKAYVMNPFTDSILINTDKVMDGLVTELKLASEAVTTAKIKVGNITNACIATSAITETKIASNSISSPKILSGAITTAKLDAYAVTAAKIDALAVTAEKIAASAVTADKIAAGAVTAVKIDVATLSAISANCGTLTAGTINGVTIYAGGGNVTLNSYGLILKGSAICQIYSGSTYIGDIGALSTGIDIAAASGKHIFIYGGGTTSSEIVLGLVKFIRMSGSRAMILPQYSSAPSSPEDGTLVFNSSTGYTNVYFGGAWHHLNRDAGWA